MSRKKNKFLKQSKDTKSTINIALICDEGYAVPTMVTIQSIISNSSNVYAYEIYVVVSELLEKYCAMYSEMSSARNNINITVIKCSDDLKTQIKNLHKGENDEFLVATSAALLKFFLPDILSNCDKVLYLDGDLIVKADLSELYFTDINDYYLAAVRDLPQVIFKDSLISIGENPRDYFNSGVMLMNLKRFRVDNIGNKLIDTKIKQKDDNLMDQNVFNIVLGSNVYQLHCKYNVCYTNLVRSKDQYKYKDLNNLYQTNYNSLADIYADAAIIHFSSKLKPWTFWDTHLADEWLFYYKISPLGKEILFRTGKHDRITVDKETAQSEINALASRYEVMSEFQQIVPIVFAANNNYAPYAAVTIAYVIAHASEDCFYDIYILHDEDFMLATKNMLTAMCGKNYSVNCIDVRKGISSKDLYSRAHYSVQMYYRLLIPEILTQYDKVLYLDCDVIINKDAASLFNIDIGNNIFGAINNFVNKDMKGYLVDKLKISPEKYINSGVLVINCDEFLREKTKAKCFATLNEMGELMCPDQDIINIVCKNKIEYLDDRWNFQWHHQWMNKFGEGAKLINEYKARYNTIKNDFWLIHYTSGMKPWLYPELNYANFFWEYARKTMFYEQILFTNVKSLFMKSLDSYLGKALGKSNALKGDVFARVINMELSQKEKQINRLSNEIIDVRTDLIKTRASFSFRIGQFLTFIPRKIRNLFRR